MNLQDEELLAQLRTTEEVVCCIMLVGWFSYFSGSRG
jgi:hypothetical protein